MSSISKSDIEIGVQAATSFVQLYYAAYDAATRMQDVPKFYRSSSSVSWNGTPLTGPEGLEEVLKEMPATVHNVQSFDCHPIPDTNGPALMVSVSGTVEHGPAAPSAPAAGEKKEKGAGRSVDGQPRVFSQTFVLTRDEAGAGDGDGEGAKLGTYVVKADTLRFVG